jgi:RNA polymerase sigma-70 factor (ECF subfamily)
LQHSHDPRATPAPADRAAADVLVDLIARVAQGDRGAFRALFEIARGRTFGLCLRMLRDRGEAEEAVQDAFVRVWGHAAGFRSEAPPLAWILAIARNRCLEILRRRGVDDGDWDEATAEALADASPTPEQRSLRAETARTIGDCLRGLDPPQRQAIELAFYDGLSHAEAAERLARPIGTVKSQIRRGLARLKSCLEGL